ncbi:MAG: ester cyclase [Candidatus Promineifilaceae bacterium]|jgi:predicted ester cyclase
MTSQNIATANKWYGELWSQGKLEIADAIIDPVYAPEWVQIDATGPEQIKHEVKYFRSAFPDLVYEIVGIVEQGNEVWVRYRGTATHAGTAWGFEPTGNQVTFEGAAILTFNESGKICDRWGAFCLYDILADLELVPPFWQLHEHFG